MERKQRLHEVSYLNNASGYMRPFIGKDGKAYVLNYKGGKRDDITNYEKQLVSNATLRYDEWRRLDDAVLKVAEQRLVGYNDLRRNGLVYQLNNPMATTVLTWEQMSDAMEAALSIDPIRRTQGDRVTFETKHIPIPIVHSDYTIGERVLQESRVRGNGLDTLSAERATRKVLVQLEDMLFGSTSSLTYGGGTIYTYLTHPDINTINFDSTGVWTAAGKTAANIKDDVLAMKSASIADKHYGPWMLYVPTAYETVLDDDYSVSGASSKTVRQRIMDISGIQGIQVVDRLAANTVLLVQMTSDVVDLIDGMGIQNVEWSSEGGFVHNYKVMAIQIPRIKSDINNTSGIVKLVSA